MAVLKLKAIEIYGFKSFADKTRIDFEKPVTCVVGPNGSGKSNIADAILWVTGEQSTRALRGGKMEDVIFGGTQTRHQMGYAEVSLILDNEDGAFPLETSEVMITRRYFRSGESEYYINRSQCRLKDVNELLMDTGMGREGYSIIGQGRIDEILSSKSTDRRAVFEEAAGISRYRHRKEESERKLQRTEENLVRVNDKIDELELQIEPLSRQAETAKKYLLLRDELRDVEIAVWTERLKALAADRERFEELERSNALELERAKAEMELHYDETERFSLRMQEKDRQADALRAETAENDEKVAAEENRAAVLRANLESAAAERARIEGELREDEDRDQAIASQIDERKQRLTEIGREEQALADTAEALARSLRELTRSSEESDRAAAELLEREQNLLSALQKEQTAVSALAAAAQEMEDRDSTARREAMAASEKLDQIRTEAEECANRSAEANGRAAELDNRIAGYRMRTESREKKAEENERRRQQLEMDVMALDQRVAMLREMEKEYTGYTRAVKTVMQEAGRGLLKGVNGTVGSLLKTADAYAVAVETALGGSMQDIIVDDEESGKACINLLKRRDAGRGTFLPVRTMSGSRLNVKGLDGESGFVGVALDLVSFDSRYEGVYSYLLGRTAVLEDMDAAIRVSRKYPKAFRIVTLDGQVINTSGSMTGGSLAKNAGILSRANELANLTERGKTLKETLRQAEAAAAAAAAEYEDARHTLEVTLESRREMDGELVRLQSEAEHYAILTDAAEQALDDMRRVSLGLEERLADNTRQVEEHRRNEQSLSAQLEELRGQTVKATRGREELQERYRHFSEEMQNIRERQASLTAERISQESACAELGELRERLLSGKDRQSDYMEGLRGRTEEMDLELAECLRQIGILRQKGDDLKRKIEKVTGEKLTIEGERTRHDRRMQERNEAVLTLEREASTLQQKLLGCGMEEKQLVDRLWDTYELTRSMAMEMARPQEDLAEAGRRAAELKRSISRLGTPNIGAIEEFDRVNERYTFLTTQRDDIQTAKDELTGIISDITDEMKVIFAREFAAINEQFRQTFLELFGGGRAELELEDEEDILNCGIEIRVQPPGKALKTIMLLSGGEKAFVAIALYFAVLKVRPAPFVVMDEIEAALDEANVTRFASYMRQMADKTQIVVISHRRGTMEEADVLYGVTMQEQGVSRVLTVDLDEAERSIEKA